jgi:hypothetical protein
MPMPPFTRLTSPMSLFGGSATLPPWPTRYPTAPTAGSSFCHLTGSDSADDVVLDDAT